MTCCVLPIYAEDRLFWNDLVTAAVALNPSSLHLWFTGDGVPGVATAQLLEDIASLLRPVTVNNPRLDVVPLLPFASWSAERVTHMPDLQSVLISSKHSAEAASLLARLNASRDLDLPRLSAVNLPEASSNEGRHEEAAASVEAAGVPSQQPLAFEHVAVGGTFDRLHVGHRLLLAATALVTTQRVFVGVTGDKLLANKSHRELLEPYEQRAASAEAYLKAVRPGLTVRTGALLDPKEPTAAATEEGMQALVVSQETVPGAEAINKYREEHGYPPLVVIVVDVIADTKAVAGGKVSSTALREQDAQRMQQQKGETEQQLSDPSRSWNLTQ